MTKLVLWDTVGDYRQRYIKHSFLGRQGCFNGSKLSIFVVMNQFLQKDLEASQLFGLYWLNLPIEQLSHWPRVARSQLQQETWATTVALYCG